MHISFVATLNSYGLATLFQCIITVTVVCTLGP